MKITNILAAILLLIALPLRAKDQTPAFKVDFLCCGEYINYASPAYSNAVLKAVFPYFKTFARKLDLPVPAMNQIRGFMPTHLRKTKDYVEGGMELKDGSIFGFNNGHVSVYESANCYFKLQDPDRIPEFYGPLNLTKEEAIELARKNINRLGYSLADVMADLEPLVPPLQKVDTNVVPRYNIKWMDPRGGGVVTEVEINASKKKMESIRFNHIVALKRPHPKVKVEPDPLPSGHPFRGMNSMANDINHEYAYRLVPFVFKAAEDFVRKLNLDMPLPITSNQVARFYCSNNGGVPYVDMTLKNNWYFTYRVNGITYAGSPRRFFESDNLPFRVKDYVGKWNLTEEQAVELARQTVDKLGLPQGFARTDAKPIVRRAAEIKGLPPIPRLMIEWIYPSPDKPREQWIEIEVDCDKGTVEMFHFDDVRLWDKAPDVGVPINPVKSVNPK